MILDVSSSDNVSGQWPASLENCQVNTDRGLNDTTNELFKMFGVASIDATVLIRSSFGSIFGNFHHQRCLPYNKHQCVHTFLGLEPSKAIEDL